MQYNNTVMEVEFSPNNALLKKNAIAPTNGTTEANGMKQSLKESFGNSSTIIQKLTANENHHDDSSLKDNNR